MKTRVRIGAMTIIVAAVLALTGCSTTTAIPTPTPTATRIDPASLIGQVIDPVGTTWSGTDSAGDLSVFVLQPDHTVKVTYGANTFDEPGDTWAVSAGVLSLHIYIDAANGYLDYTGQYDPATKTIAATGTTSVTSKTVTVTLTNT